MRKPSNSPRIIAVAALLLFLPTLSFASEPILPAHQPIAPAPEFVPGEILVRVQEGTSEEAVVQIAASVDAQVKQRVTSWGLYLFTFDANRPVARMAEQLVTHPAVEYAEPNQVVEAFSLLGSADDAAILAGAGARTIVAVIDTGMDLTHSDLVDHLWTNPGEVAGDGIDNDGNGFVDDIHGANFWEGNGDPTGTSGSGAHGTQVAGMVVQGAVDPAAQIMSLRVGPGPGLSLSAIIGAIDYAVAKGAQVINMSFGTFGFSASLNEAIGRAANAGVVLVAAAGNSGTSWNSYPAALNGVLSVAATYTSGRRAYFSNYGDTVDFSAPGYQVTTTTFGGGQAVVSGTSFSSPFVAGVAARILASNPDLTPDEVADRIRAYGKDPNASNFWFFHDKLGDGFIDSDVAQAIANAFPIVEDPPVEDPPNEDPNDGLEQALRDELALAQAELDQLNVQLLQAALVLFEAQQNVEAVQQELANASANISQYWQDFISAWRAYFWANFFRQGSSQDRADLRAEMEEARDQLFQAFRDRREAQQRLRVAEAQVKTAQRAVNGLTSQVAAAQDRVDQIQRRLDGLVGTGSSAAETGTASSQQLQLLQQLHQLHQVHQNISASPLPDGFSAQEAPFVLMPGSDRRMGNE